MGNIRPVPPAPTRGSASGGRVDFSGSAADPAGSSRGSWQPARLPTPHAGETLAATQEPRLADQLLEATRGAKTYYGTSVPKAIPLPTTNFVIPKYKFAWSMEHMHQLAANPETNKSAANLVRA